MHHSDRHPGGAVALRKDRKSARESDRVFVCQALPCASRKHSTVDWVVEHLVERPLAVAAGQSPCDDHRLDPSCLSRDPEAAAEPTCKGKVHSSAAVPAGNVTEVSSVVAADRPDGADEVVGAGGSRPAAPCEGRTDRCVAHS